MSLVLCHQCAKTDNAKEVRVVLHIGVLWCSLLYLALLHNVVKRRGHG